MQTKTIISLRTLIKTVTIVSLPTLLVLTVYFWIEGTIDFSHFIYGYLSVMVLSTIFVYPFLSNLSALTHYVNNLARDKRVEAPDLSFLSNVGELSEALERLNRSWERRKQQMESVITEREILVDTLPDILIMINDEKRIVRINRAARNIFGQNLANKHLKEVIPNDTLLNAVSMVTRDLKGQEVEFHILEPQPKDFLAIIERFPIASSGGISIIITLNDITELKRVEQMRADFVANASHEIRTPLASIIGFIETLQGPAKEDPQARNEFLKVMAEQATRMSKLINDLLSLSKIEMNAHSVPIGKVDLLRVIRSERQHFEWAARQKNVQIHLDMSDNLPMVVGDEDELAQVVHNLIGNAIKYGTPETEVTVTLRVTTSLPSDPNFRNASRAMYLAVRDRGEGIPKEHIPRLVERFYRVDSARTRKVAGTGLGLAIVKQILNRHRGALLIESEVGVGSVFAVFLHIFEEH